MPKYRYVGTVATEVAIGDKRVPIGPGEFVTMSADEHKAANESGVHLLEVSTKKEGGDKT